MYFNYSLYKIFITILWWKCSLFSMWNFQIICLFFSIRTICFHVLDYDYLLVTETQYCFFYMVVLVYLLYKTSNYFNWKINFKIDSATIICCNARYVYSYMGIIVCFLIYLNKFIVLLHELNCINNKHFFLRKDVCKCLKEHSSFPRIQLKDWKLF